MHITFQTQGRAEIFIQYRKDQEFKKQKENCEIKKRIRWLKYTIKCDYSFIVTFDCVIEEAQPLK